jgi:hypothetical protein
MLLYSLSVALQVVLTPLCFLFAWILMGLICWSVATFLRDTFGKAQQMHQIPCSDCRFFTDDYRLKCTVHPTIALSEAAIQCPDFQNS